MNFETKILEELKGFCYLVSLISTFVEETEEEIVQHINEAKHSSC